MDYLQSEQTMLSEIKRLAGESAKIVFVSGNFNIVHPGHLRLLQFAVECGNFLVVGVSGEGADGATLAENLRLEGVNAISFVNYAFILRARPEVFVARLRPAVVGKGQDEEGRGNPERPVVAMLGDGCMLMTLGELAIAAERKMPLVIVVLNDAKLSLIALKQDKMKMAPRGVDFESPDFAKIASGFGARGIYVDALPAFEESFDEAMSSRRLTVIDASIDPAEYWEQM